MQGRERAYLTWFYQSFSWRRGAFGAADIDEYLRTYTPAGCAARRLRLLPQHPARHRRQPRPRSHRGFRLPMPVLAVGGGRAEARGRGSEPEESLKVIADDVHGAVVADSGHFVPEEQPDELAALLLEHFGRG